jgi:hypothetical protein
MGATSPLMFRVPVVRLGVRPRASTELSRGPHAEGSQRSLGDEGWCTSVEIGRWLFRSSADFAFHSGLVPRRAGIWRYTQFPSSVVTGLGSAVWVGALKNSFANGDAGVKRA